MRIGELANRVGLHSTTIRYYEAIGLLPVPTRSAAGYRQYDERAILLLEFTQRAKHLGLSLDEIRTILTLYEHGEQPCDRVLAVIEAERAQVMERIRELTRLESHLATLHRQWSDVAIQPASTTCVCPIIEGSRQQPSD